MAIIYELPNGKCVHISVEQLLALDDADLQYMIATNAGYHSSNPHRKLKYPDGDSTPEEQAFNDFTESENSPDMLSDGDDIDYDVDLDNFSDDN